MQFVNLFVDKAAFLCGDCAFFSKHVDWTSDDAVGGDSGGVGETGSGERTHLSRCPDHSKTPAQRPVARHGNFKQVTLVTEGIARPVCFSLS